MKAVYVVFLGTQEKSPVAKHSYGYPKEKHLFFQQTIYSCLKVVSLHLWTKRYPAPLLHCSSPPQGGVIALIMHLGPMVLI